MGSVLSLVIRRNFLYYLHSLHKAVFMRLCCNKQYKMLFNFSKIKLIQFIKFDAATKSSLLENDRQL